MYRAAGDKAHGPYRHGERWRVIVVAATGARRTLSFESERKALQFITDVQIEADTRLVSGAIDAYLAYKRDVDQLKLTSRQTAEHRLRALFRVAENDRVMRSVTAKVAQGLYDRRVTEVKPETSRLELSEAKRFGAWLVKSLWLERDPFADVEPATKPGARRERGKPKLHITEARKFLAAALSENTDSGLAAAMALLMGCRASEITDRLCRDVDDDARVLWVERAKTEAGDRCLEIPECLRERLLAQVAGRRGDAKLFPERDRHWVHYHTVRLCSAARVPRITPHGARGTHSSIAAQAVPVEHVARALGHVGPAVTRRHYLAPGAESVGKQRVVTAALAKSAPNRGNFSSDSSSHGADS